MLTGFKIIHVAAHTVPAYSYTRRFTQPDKKAPKKKAPAKMSTALVLYKAPSKMSTALVPYKAPIRLD